MYLKILFQFLFIVGTAHAIFGQTDTLNTKVFFDKNKAFLRIDAQQNLDKLLDSLQQVDYQQILLEGHTDNVQDSSHNWELSKRRNESVYAYLLEKGIDKNRIQFLPFGKSKPLAPNTTEAGKQLNRRVDIVVVYTKNKTQQDSANIVAPSQKDSIKIDTLRFVKIEQWEDTCSLCDTTIFLPQGVTMTFNRKEFLDIKDCMQIEVSLDIDTMLARGLSTINVSGNPMVSCGMFSFSYLTNPSCGGKDKCLNKPVTIRLPEAKCANNVFACYGRGALYRSSAQGWQTLDKNKDAKIRYVKDPEGNYYEIQMKCPFAFNGYNCDCELGAYSLKLKPPKKHKLIEWEIFGDCPNLITKKLKSEQKTCLPCLGANLNITAKVANRQGEILELSAIPLNDLPHNLLNALDCKKIIFRSRCKQINTTSKDEFEERRLLGIFKVRKKARYRKYFIPKELLKPTNETLSTQQ